jgi:parvulin-like peptidyl-prolyl isomerase
MHDGLLGRIKPGQLYPELDEVLFGMEEGSLSGVIRSPMGLHLLLCEKIHQAGRVAFDEVKESLQAQLEKKKRTRLLREWLQQAA